MKALGRYAAASIIVVLAIVGAAWPFLGDPGRSGLLVAAAIAVPVQLGAFALVSPAVGDPQQFLIRWALGVLARVAVVVALGVTRERFDGVDPAALVLSACGFFFALLVLEPVFFLNKRSERFAQ